MELVKLVLWLILSITINLLLIIDSKRILRAFFLHLERKLLLIHSAKLVIFFILVYKFSKYIRFSGLVLLVLLGLLLLFLSLLTLKQVEFAVKGTLKSKYKTFHYTGTLVQYILYVLVYLANIKSILKNRSALKEKTKQVMYIMVFPVQKYIMVSMTGLELPLRKQKHITKRYLTDIKESLQPGDILLKRNNWQMTNLGISGFWTHSGLYIGNLEELDSYFGDLPVLEGEKFTDKLKKRNIHAYENMVNNNELTVIEAIAEGVVVKELSNIAEVDYFAVLRPVCFKEEKMIAIRKAFSFVGKPYDYYIDIDSSDAFVCTSVIRKAYENIITLPVSRRAGKKVVLPNHIAKKFANERIKKNKELNLVLFYDYDPKTKRVRKSTEKEFAESSKRGLAYYRRAEILKYFSYIHDHKN